MQTTDASAMTAGFIGGGNMGSALVRGLLRSGTPPERVTVGEPVQSLRQSLATELGVRVTADNAEAIAGAQIVVLAVKPQEMQTTLAPLREALLAARPVVLSVAAGVRVESLRSWCGAQVPIVRAMPNRPATVGAGACGLYAAPGTPNAARDLAMKVVSASGTAVWVGSEEALDIVTALSGSGPAYFFLLTELMVEAAINLGLERSTARELALQTLYGAGVVARQSDGDLQRLRAEVTSKGGTTAAALASFEADELRAIVARALGAAAARSAELARGTPSKPD
jgi:pyrroline-5-carboxylate reductase